MSNAATLTDLFRAYLTAHKAMVDGTGSGFASREARRAVTTRIREVAAARKALVFTATLYDGDKVDVVEAPSADYRALHSSLVNRGFTCLSQTYGPDDSVLSARFGHTLNPALSARITS